MFPNTGSRSRLLHSRATLSLPGGNSRHTVYFPPYPIYAVRGEGARVIDADGVSRLDLINNYSSLIHGHNHPKIVEAVVEQAHKLLAVALPTEAEVELAEILCDRLPSVEQVRFANSGTEGVMMAIKAARAYTGRRLIAKIEGAYHGSSDSAAVSTSPAPNRWGDARYPTSVAEPGSGPGTADDMLVLSMNDVEAGRASLRQHGSELAGVLIDPLVKNLAFQPASPEFLAMLREETTAAGALLIFDEVYSLRLGFNGAQQALGVRADLTALGKIIGGGLPVGAVGGSAEIMTALFDPRPGKVRLAHGGTYNANPLTMAAGSASMKLFDREAFDRLSLLGDRLRAGFEEIIRITGVPATVRGKTSMVGLFQGRMTGGTYRDVVAQMKSSPAIVERSARFFEHMLNNGVFFGAAGFFVLSTALTEADIDFVLDKTLDGFRMLATLPD
ncbi:MAG: aspartate aminotransferase family protein [Sphingomonas sp.]|nr:MAG: aspartate aminotransferase family protein [Sphingomonas sp.]